MSAAAGADDYRVADRLQIQDAIYTWCRGVDRRDWGLIREAFHSDGTDDHGSYQGGIDGLIEYLKQRHAQVLQSQHHVGNILIEFAGADRALAESYVVGYSRVIPANREARIASLGYDDGVVAGPLDAAQSGRYLDRFERRAGRWRIAHRTLVWEANQVRPGTPEIWRGALPRTLARRDGDDALWKLRRELGLKPGYGGDA
jgi:hypothetical protein